MSTIASASSGSHSCAELPTGPPRSSMLSSQPRFKNGKIGRDDTSINNMSLYAEKEEGCEGSALQDPTTYTALSDIVVMSRSSSTTTLSAEKSNQALDRLVHYPEESLRVCTPNYNLSDHNQDTTLVIRYESILALINDLIQKIDRLPETVTQHLERGSLVAVLEKCSLDLRIWSSDLTVNNASALDRLDTLKDSENRCRATFTNLQKIMTDMSKIILSLAAQMSAYSFDPSVSANTGIPFRKSHLAHKEVLSLPRHSGDIAQINKECDELQALVGKLLAEKSAIRAALSGSLTTALISSSNAASNSKPILAPAILCFDGGGIKSYSSLLILRALMERISLLHNDGIRVRETNEARSVRSAVGSPQLRPADIFDFMYGSSSGGLIAIMLGRLGMTVDECITKYLEYAKAVFEHAHWFSGGGYLRPKYSQKRLIQATRRIIGDFDPTSKGEQWKRNMFASSTAPCKTGVLACDINRGQPYMFRTYEDLGTPDGPLKPLYSDIAHSYQLWEVAIATTAAPTYFSPAKIDDVIFADGGLVANNPSQEALNEVISLNNATLNDICLVSIGSGLTSLTTEQKLPRSISKESKTGFVKKWKILAEAIKVHVTQTESTHGAVKAQLDHSGGTYFRFNAHGMGEIHLDEWAELDFIASHTSHHLQGIEVQQMLDQCANVLLRRLENRKRGPAKSYSDSVKSMQPELDKTNIWTKASGAYKTPFSLRDVPIVNRFIDRPEEMAKLADALLPLQTCQRKVLVLSGLGGIGKTQLSVEFARRYHDNFSAVFWLNGRSENTLKQSIAASASSIPKGQISESSRMFSTLNAIDIDSVVRDALDWLSITDNNAWLVIFDNVDEDYRDQHATPDAYDVSRYFPKSDHGSILLTTRLANLGQLGISLFLSKFDYQQALAMITDANGTPFEESDEIRDLLNILDGLPLALAQASAFMRETSTSFADYSKFYKEQWRELMDSEGDSQLPLQDYRNGSIWTTWTVSYQAIRRRDEAAANLLLLWAYLDTELWFELLQPAFAKLASINDYVPEPFLSMPVNKLAFSKSMKLLLGYSIVEKKGSSSSYSIHPVVHEWAWRMQEENTRTKYTVLAILVVGFAVPPSAQKESWVLQQRLLPHANGVAQHALIELAEERGFKAYLKLDGSLCLMTLDAFQSLGDLFLDQGKLVEANTMYQRALAGKEEALGPDLPSTLDTVNSLGKLYRIQGKLAEAESTYERALHGRYTALGPDHVSTLDTINNLAVLYGIQGRLDKADAMYKRALAGKENALGRDHISALDTVNNLADLYRDQGRLAEAEALYQRALVGEERMLGPEHPSTLVTVNNLAVLYSTQDRWHEAKAMYERALTGCEKALGEDHMSTLDTVNNLASLYQDQGRLTEAEALYQRALIGEERTLGLEHPSTLITVNNLGRLYADQGKLREAEEMYQRALQGKEKAFGTKHTSTLRTINNLGLLYAKQGKLMEAEETYERALQGYEEALGANHPLTLGTVNNLGHLYADQGKLREAEEMYQRALQGKEKVFGTKHTSTLDTINNLGLLCAKQGKLMEAEEMYKQALRGYEDAVGLENVETYRPALNTMLNRGDLYVKQGELNQAHEAYSRALIGFQIILGPSSDKCQSLKATLESLNLPLDTNDSGGPPVGAEALKLVHVDIMKKLKSSARRLFPSFLQES